MWSFFSRDSSKDFPYEIGELQPGLEAKGIWSLHKAKRKNSGDEVSVFVYDIKSGTDVKLELAKASVKKLKTLRHPSVLQFLDSLETDKVLYVATEYVEPLGTLIDHLDMDPPQRSLYLAWGIFQITVCDMSFSYLLHITSSFMYVCYVCVERLALLLLLAHKNCAINRQDTRVQTWVSFV